MNKAKAIINDCKWILERLDTVNDRTEFRVLWISGLALLRSVGHALKNSSNQDVAKASLRLYEHWKATPDENHIFYNFIKRDRDNILKEYSFNYLDQPVPLLLDSEITIIDDLIFCPISEGMFEGEDCRDVFRSAIDWWIMQLDALSSVISKRKM